MKDSRVLRELFSSRNTMNLQFCRDLKAPYKPPTYPTHIHCVVALYSHGLVAKNTHADSLNTQSPGDYAGPGTAELEVNVQGSELFRD